MKAPQGFHPGFFKKTRVLFFKARKKQKKAKKKKEGKEAKKKTSENKKKQEGENQLFALPKRKPKKTKKIINPKT